MYLREEGGGMASIRKKERWRSISLLKGHGYLNLATSLRRGRFSP